MPLNAVFPLIIQPYTLDPCIKTSLLEATAHIISIEESVVVHITRRFCFHSSVSLIDDCYKWTLCRQRLTLQSLECTIVWFPDPQTYYNFPFGFFLSFFFLFPLLILCLSLLLRVHTYQLRINKRENAEEILIRGPPPRLLCISIYGTHTFINDKLIPVISKKHHDCVVMHGCTRGENNW